jgi:thiol-disulfide isomerase/thioredoxin
VIVQIQDNKSKMYILEYVGATWCATCKVIKPAAEQLCKKYSITFKAYDIDELKEEERETITKVPTLTIRDIEGKSVIIWNKDQIASLTLWLQHNINLETDDF